MACQTRQHNPLWFYILLDRRSVSYTITVIPEKAVTNFWPYNKTSHCTRLLKNLWYDHISKSLSSSSNPSSINLPTGSPAHMSGPRSHPANDAFARVAWRLNFISANQHVETWRLVYVVRPPCFRLKFWTFGVLRVSMMGTIGIQPGWRQVCIRHRKLTWN